MARVIARIRDDIARELKINEYVKLAFISNPMFDEGRFRAYINELRAGKSPSGILRFSQKTKVTDKGDAWGRGQVIQPIYAVAGANDTGSWSDSPCPTVDVNKELAMIKKELAQAGVPTKEFGTHSSNVFMGRRWLVAPIDKFPMAKKLAKKLIKKHESDTKYLYGAD